MFLAFYALFDILVSFTLLAPDYFLPAIFWIGIIALVKGATSILGSAAAKFYFDFMGLLDLLAGISIIFHYYIPFLWFLVLLKGMWSLFFGLFGK